MARGRVGIGACNGSLRLQWTHEGKQKAIYLGLPDTPENRRIAELKAKQIETDLILGAYDPSLEKYKPRKKAENGPTVVELFLQFTDYKAKRIDPAGLANYKATLQAAKEFFKNKLADRIDEDAAHEFANWLFQVRDNAMRTVSVKVGHLKACWTWAIKKKLVAANPWENMGLTAIARLHGKAGKKQVEPFTVDEIAQILEAFRSHPTYHYYFDYVFFLFGTGCRTGEAIGLRWKNVADDCAIVRIQESLSLRVRKPTKTNKNRNFKLTLQLQEMLRSRRPENPDPDGLIFTTPQGLPIDRHNFRNRAWVPILESLGIDYRKPYTTRATLTSHALEQGMSPASVAQITGHSPRTLYENYLGSVVRQPQLPDLF